jgi:outer membrane immunogenic protein
MRRVLLTTISISVLTATGALAADLPRSMPVKAPAYVAAYNWSGFYLGINGGYGWGRSHWSAFGSSNSPAGGLVGGTIGYNWQGLGSPWVFGLEGDVDWSGMRNTFTTAACPTGCETRNNWLATARGRIGYAFNNVMPYITGGLAVGDIEANQGGFPGASDTKAGWTAGGGVEAAIANTRWTAKLEYLYADLGHVSCAAGSCSLPTNVSFRTNIVRAGLNYRF